MPQICGKVSDILKSCDNSSLNLVSGLLLVKREAVELVKDATNPFLVTSLTIKDPTTGLYPAVNSDYYPVKAEWYNNSVVPNYEVVEGGNAPDMYSQTVGKVVLFDSETATGKQSVKGLNASKWLLVSKVSGTVNEDSSFHIYGATHGLKFLVEPTAPEFGNRVVGMFKSSAGAEESTPNGLNLLITSIANTKSLFNQRFSTVVIP